jgi:D-glycero-alpha-D-manno-heptose 1-phosphate guanylyltransferase
MVKTAIILAGGLGTRLKDTVPDLPKPMAPIKGRPFLEYQMDFWINQGINRFILSVGYLSDIIINHFGYKYRGAILEYSVESNPLGTGGALIQALKNLSEPVLVINGDTFFEVDLKVLYSFHCSNESVFTLSLYKVNESKRYLGIDVANNGKILELCSSNGEPLSAQLVNGGAYIVDPLTINTINFKDKVKLSLEDDILIRLLDEMLPLFGKEFKGKFIDIGIPKDYYRAKEIL